jgi:hypothetical protein
MNAYRNQQKMDGEVLTIVSNKAVQNVHKDTGQLLSR